MLPGTSPLGIIPTRFLCCGPETVFSQRLTCVIHFQVPLEFRSTYRPVLAWYGLFWRSALQHLLPTLQSETDPSVCHFLCPVGTSTNSTIVKTHANYLFRFSATDLSISTPTIYWLSMPSSGFLIPLHLDKKIHGYLQIVPVTALEEITLFWSFLPFTFQTVALALTASELSFSHSRW